MGEGSGVEPHARRHPWVSGPVASHLAVPSNWSERRDSNSLRPVLQTGASTASASLTWHPGGDSNTQSRLWRPLSSPSETGAFGGRGEGRTLMHEALVPKTSVSANSTTRPNAESGVGQQVAHLPWVIPPPVQIQHLPPVLNKVYRLERGHHESRCDNRDETRPRLNSERRI